VLWIALTAATAPAATLLDSADTAGGTGIIGLPTTGTGTETEDTDIPVPVVWSEGDGAAEISGESGGHSWDGCAHAPVSLWGLPVVLAFGWRSRR
jgi:hypothetical protein